MTRSVDNQTLTRSGIQAELRFSASFDDRAGSVDDPFLCIGAVAVVTK
jgi:hypothetical protein